MRICYIHSANILMPSANAVQTMHVCQSLARTGAEVELLFPHYVRGDVLSIAECHAYYAVDDCFRVRHLRAPFSRALMQTPGYVPVAKLLAYWVECCRQLLSRSAFDVIYTRCATASAFFPWLSPTRSGTRPLVLFEAHEYPRTRARGVALRSVDGIIAISRAIAEELEARLAIPSERILVAPDGVPDAWLTPATQDQARAALGLHAEQALALYTGTVHPDTKPMLFDAAAALRGRASLIVVGAAAADYGTRGRYLIAMEAEARQLQLPIVFVGPVSVDRVRQYQIAADVLVAPYSGALRWARYTSPLKLFEYMAAGRPIVTSDLPVLHEILAHDDTAWFVPVGDGTAIGRAAGMMLDRPDVAKRLARRAQEAAAGYTWDRRARTILEFVGRRKHGH